MRSAGSIIRKPTMKQMKEAFDMFSEVVVKEKRIEFLGHGNRDKKLRKFIEKKILGFRDNGDRKQARRLQRQLDAMGYKGDSHCMSVASP